MNNKIINKIKNIHNKSYLELGLGNGRNFDGVLAVDKTSVDINGRGTFTGTTDEFFESLTHEEWDVIFIDANHEYHYVLRDYNNSVVRCREWIAIHDLIPPSEKYVSARFCGDGYKLLYCLLAQTNTNVFPMNNNFGFTMIRMPAQPIAPPIACSKFTYMEFQKFIKDIKLYSEEEIERML
jgi:hypothetical protein